MDPRTYAQKGSPAEQIVRLAEEERRLDARELELLYRGAEAQLRARALQEQLDQLLGELQGFALTTARAEAEALFFEAFSSTIPPHVSTAETTRALDLRRKAYVARLQSSQAESAAIAARSKRLEEVDRALVELRRRADALALRVHGELKTEPPPPLEPRGAPGAAAPAAPQPAGAPAAPAAPDAAQPPPSGVLPVAALSPLSLVLNLSSPPPRPTTPPTTRELSALPLAPPDERAAKRLKLRAAVTMSSGHGILLGFLRDLSSSGVFVATYQKGLPKGSAVEVSLPLSGGRMQRIPGTVKWMRDPADCPPGTLPGMGVSFESMTPEAMAAVYAFLNAHERDFWEE